MKNFDKMVNAISLSKESDIPFLLVGNPGFGKTTVVHAWAKQNGYHVEEIMGSSFSRDEVLGYMVNVNGSLEMLEPFWFKRIKKLSDEGIKSVLFIDELSTTGGDVQSSLLRLIFERTIGNGESLPEGTIVMSAANYKANLPGYCDVSSPAANRFCIINLEEASLETMVDDYVINEMPTPKSPKFGTINPSNMAKIRLRIGNSMKKTFIKYSSSEDGGNVLNPLNHNLQIYDVENDINTKRLANFISGRSLNFLLRVLVSIARSDIEETEPLIRGVVEGLVGAGTNTFPSETVQEAYISYMTDSFTDDVAKIRKMFVKYDNVPTYEAATNKLVEDTKKVASSSDNDKLFENIRRNVEYNPEEREQIAADVNQLAVAIKIQGRNFTKKYMNDAFFKSVCDYLANVYAPFAKKAKIDRTVSDYVRYYLRKIEKNNVEAA
jgi:DNA polymerase III delta prime subunit